MLDKKWSKSLWNIYQTGMLIGISLVLGSCNGNGVGSSTSSGIPTASLANTSQTKSSQKHHGGGNSMDNFYMQGMGAGYDTSTNSVTSGQSCLAAASNQNNIIIANPSALVTFEQQQDFSTLQNDLGVSISGQYSGGMFSGSLAAQYAVNSQDTRYTTNLIYLYQYAGASTFAQGVLGESDAALTPVAASLVHTNQTAFRAMCGNDYIAQMNAGVLLGVTLTLSFNSHMDQQTFNAQLQANIGLANISASIQQAANNSNVHVNFSMSAIQMGGEPQQLNNLFGQVESNGEYPYVECGSVGGSNAEQCNLMISSIIGYAQTIENQVTNSDGSLILDNLYYSNPAVADYSTLGIIVGAPNPGKNILEAMQTLTAQYNKAVYDYAFVTHYLTALSDLLDAPTQENLEDAQLKLGEQIENVYLSPTYQLLNCYKGYVSEDCLKIKSNVDDALAGYQLSSQESEEINYLETSSYTTNLYSYYGESVESSSDYQVSSQECVLAPISSPYAARYALNCNQLWLPIFPNASGGITIIPGINNTIAVSGLSYLSINVESSGTYAEAISYQDSTLAVDPFYSNYFTATGVNVTGGSTFSTTDGSLDLTQWTENQA